MSNKEFDKQSPDKAGKEKEKDKEVSDAESLGSGSPDVVEASEDDVQDAAYGNRSYAAPDFDDDKD